MKLNDELLNLSAEARIEKAVKILCRHYLDENLRDTTERIQSVLAILAKGEVGEWWGHDEVASYEDCKKYWKKCNREIEKYGEVAGQEEE